MLPPTPSAQCVCKQLQVPCGRTLSVSVSSLRMSEGVNQDEQGMEEEVVQACIHDDCARLEQLLTCGVDANTALTTDLPLGAEGGTLLHLAAILGRLQVICSLLARGANPNAQDTVGWTPMMHALVNGHQEIVEMLLADSHYDGNVVDIFQQTALHIEAQNKCDTGHCAELLVQHGASLNRQDVEGVTPLMRAIETSNGAVVDIILRAPCDVNICAYSGRTALHVAATKCDPNLIERLIKQGANANALDNHLQIPLMLCVQQRKPSYANMLQSLHHLVQAGSNINCQDCQGNTVFLLAMNNPSAIKKPHIELLLSCSADPNIPNRDGLTPLWQSVYDGIQYPDRLPIIQLLLEENCYPNMSCRGKLLFTSGIESVYCYETFMSPLEVALDSGFYSAAKMLILAGCQIKKDLRYDTQMCDVPEELQWFQKIVENPNSLQQQCRIVIRKILGDGVQLKALKLPLPQKIRSFVLLEDLADFLATGDLKKYVLQ